VKLQPLLAIFLLLPASCAEPLEGRVESRLEAAGISPPMSRCMAHRWVEQLSIWQLRKIQGLTNDLSREHRDGTLTVPVLIERVRAVHDPEIFKVVSSSAAHCALHL